MERKHQEYNHVAEAYRAVILGECLDMLRRYPDAPVDIEDIVQDVCVTLYENIELVKQAENRKAYVRTCARRTAWRTVAKALRCPVAMEFEAAIIAHE